MNSYYSWGGGYSSGWGMMGGHGVFINVPYWVPDFLEVLVPIIIVCVLWSLFWKVLALWHSARRGSYWWFIIFLLVNTLGILEIIYLFGVAKLKLGELFSSRTHSK